MTDRVSGSIDGSKDNAEVDYARELQKVQERSSDRDRMFTPYGELVTILEAPEHALDEILQDCDKEQLLKIINVVEDNLNDIADNRSAQRDFVKRLLYVRFSAIRQFRSRIGVPENEQWSQYSPVDDFVIDSYLDKGGEIEL